MPTQQGTDLSGTGSQDQPHEQTQQTPPPPPRAWVGDDEPAEEADAPDTEGLTDDEPAGDDPPGESEPRDPNKEPWSAPLRKMQQRQTTAEQKMDQILSLLQQGQQQPQAKPQDQASAKPAPDPAPPDDSDIDSILSEVFGDADDEIDAPTTGQVRKAITAILKRQASPKQQSLTNEQIVEIVKPLIDQVRQEIAPAQQVAANAEYERFWSQFEKANGFDGKAEWEQTYNAIAKRYPNFSADEVNKAAAVVFDEKVEARKAQRQQQAQAPARPAARTGPGTRPPTSTEGAQTQSQSASRRTSTASQARPRPKAWIGD